MMRTWLAALAIALPAAPAYAKLEISKIQAVYGRLGPVRTSNAYYANDEVSYRYLISGAKADTTGTVDCEVTVKLVGPDGKSIENQVYSAQGILNFGGDSFPGSTQLTLPADAAPGVYVLTVSIKDRLSNEVATFRRNVSVKETEFAIVAPRFSYDLSGQVDSPAAGTVDQTLYIRLKVIGFDRSRNRIDNEMNIRVLDQNGKDVTPNPIRIKGLIEDPEVVKDADHLNFKGELYLNQAGNFKLSIAVIDWISKKTVRFETPLRVVDP
jgi:hypothetical protein